MKQYRHLRKKTTAQKGKDEETQSTINSIKTWTHHLEQNINSISARLVALEKRMSLEEINPRAQIHSVPDTPRTAKTEPQKTIDKTEDSFQRNIQQEYEKLTQKIHTVQRQQQELESILQTHQKQSLKQAIIMRIGSKEFPLEITGIIAGLISFIIAFLVLIGGKDIVLSPLFLFLIGCLLIASSFLRSTPLYHILKNIISLQQDNKKLMESK